MSIEDEQGDPATRARRADTTVRESARTPSRGVDVLFVSGVGVLRITFGAAGAVVATLVLGAAERGLMVLGALIGTVVPVLAGLGSSTAVKLRLPARTEPGSRDRLVAAYTWWSLAAAGCAVGIAVAASVLSARVIEPAMSGRAFLVAVAVFTAAQALYWQTTDAWFADGRFRRGSLSAALITAGGLGGLLTGAMVSRSAPVLLLAQGVGMAVLWSCQLGGLRAARLISLSRPHLREIGGLVAVGFPTLGLVVGLAIAVRADQFVLAATAGTTAVGVYALAVSLTEVPRLLPQAMGQLFMRDMTLGIGHLRLHRWLTLSVVAAVAGNAVVVLAGWFLIVPLFGAEFAAARGLLPILAVAEACFAPYAVASLGLVGGGWVKAAGALGVVGGVGAIACYAVSAGLAGPAGVAVGSVVVYTGLSGAAYLLLRRRFEPRAGGRLTSRRVVDVVLACLALVVTSPLMVGVAVLTRCSLGRPVLFRQQRLGLHGEQFTMLKFRTMRPKAYAGQPDRERTTRLSAVLRTLSLDELPQFVNIVRGEMSVIGPRPGLPEHLRCYDQRQRGRLAVLPGLTGWAQVNGRNSLSMPERIELDLWYVEHRSWLVDLRILAATVGYLVWPRNVLAPEGVNPEFVSESEEIGPLDQARRNGTCGRN